MKHSLFHAAAAAACLLAATAAQAANFTVSGQSRFHNDVVQVDFTLTAAAINVAVWTDSWLSGVNFDPMAALWVAANGNHSLLTQVDDDDQIGAGQGFYDAGFRFANLAAGQYRVTLVAAFNGAVGSLLSQGFAYDGEAPILLSQWNQPSYDPNLNNQKGGFWRLNFSNVDGVTVVPEPTAALLMALGLAGLGMRAHRRQTGR